MTNEIILASNSAVRKAMLEESSVAFRVVPSPYDEDAHKEAIRSQSPAQQSLVLAKGKAEAVSRMHRQALVIGADQICALDTMILDKPGDEARAARHLQLLQGRTHHQYSGACVYHDGACVWDEVEVVTLTMRPLSEVEIVAYVRRDMPLQACGGYCYEKHGHTLFSHVEGSAAAIKGLPLKGLLEFLQGWNAS